MLFPEADEIDENENLEIAAARHGIELYDDGKQGLKPPEASPVMVGHEAIEQEFLRWYHENNFPHGLIFSGVSGIGKATMAYRLARFLLVRGVRTHDDGGGLFGDSLPQETYHDMNVDMAHPVSSKIAAGSHTDLKILQKDSSTVRGEIKVDSAREIPRFLQKTSAEGGWRIVIVDDADYLKYDSQNAILKTLEEPPKNSLLILIAASKGRLLPTIRSRCRMVDFAPLQKEHIENLMELDDFEMPDGLDMNAVVTLSGGRYGFIKSSVKAENIDIYRRALELLAQSPNLPRADIHNFSDFIALGKKGEYDLLFDWLIRLCERAIQSKARMGEFLSVLPEEQNVLQAWDNLNPNLDFLYKKWERLKQNYSQTVASNLDRKHSIFTAFQTLGTKENV